MSDFRLTLIVILVALIAIIFIHSVWKIRKSNAIELKTESKEAKKFQNLPDVDAPNPEIISEVRVRAKLGETDEEQTAQVHTLVEVDNEQDTDVLNSGAKPLDSGSPKAEDSAEELSSKSEQGAESSSEKEAFLKRQKSLFDAETEDSSNSKTSTQAQKDDLAHSNKPAKPKSSQAEAKPRSEKPEAGKNRQSKKAASSKTSPTLGTEQAKPSVSKVPQEQIVLFVVAQADKPMPGKALMDLFSAHQLRLGEHKIFHRYDATEDNSLYCVANAMDPGHFVVRKMPEEQFQALCMILTLPNAQEDVGSLLDDMLALAGQMAEQFGVHVLDDQKSSLTQQTVSHYRQRIADFKLKNRSPA